MRARTLIERRRGRSASGLATLTAACILYGVELTVIQKNVLRWIAGWQWHRLSCQWSSMVLYRCYQSHTCRVAVAQCEASARQAASLVAPLCGSEALSQNFQVAHFIAFYIPV